MSVFEDGQRYKNYSEQEWNLKNSFSYDDYKGVSDSKLLKIQNTEMCFDIEKTFDLPFKLHLRATCTFLGLPKNVTSFGLVSELDWLLPESQPNLLFWSSS